MQRPVVYYAIVIGVAGSLALWFTGRAFLIIGWWAGMFVALFNFSFLLSNVHKSREEMEQGSKSVTRSLRQKFFLRYLVLALGLFLILQLGKPQLGSALIGFLTFYIVALLDYVSRIRKKSVRPDGT